MVHNVDELSRLLRVPRAQLNDAMKRAPRLYREIILTKPTGESRTINAPTDELKAIQRAILDEILAYEPVMPCVYGFGPGKSIVENASLHAQSPFVLNADLKNFFPSVHVSRVRRLLMALGATLCMIETLTRLTTLNHCLPQGAPTSPYLATLALSHLDRRVMKLCAANRLIYTRYFDDIAISGDSRAHELVGTLAEIVFAEGYRMHTDKRKLRFYGPRDTKVVTGIHIVDGELRVPNADEILEHVRSLQFAGLSGLSEANPLKEKMSLLGKIAFVSQVDTTAGARLRQEFDKIKW